MSDNFLHFDIGNVITWISLIFGIGVSWAKVSALAQASVARAAENKAKIEKESADRTAMVTALQVEMSKIQVDGSKGAKHLFDLLHAQVSSQDTRIALLEASARDTAEIKVEVRWMRKLMEKRWGLVPDESLP